MTFDYKYRSSPNLGELISKCQEEGKNGWELIQIIRDELSTGLYFWAILKKEIEDDIPNTGPR